MAEGRGLPPEVQLESERRAVRDGGEPLWSDERTVLERGDSLSSTFPVSLIEMWEIGKGDSLRVEVYEECYIIKRPE